MTTIVKAPCDEALIRAGTADAPCSKRAAPWVLAATILGSSIIFIDSTVVNVALPVLQRELGTDIVGAQWVVEAYALMLSALILVGGSLGDLRGRKRVFSMGLLLFAIASAGCGLAQTTAQLIIGRAGRGCSHARPRKPCDHQRFILQERSRAGHRYVVGHAQNESIAARTRVGGYCFITSLSCFVARKIQKC